LIFMVAALGGCASLEKIRPGARSAETEARIDELQAELREARRRATMAEVELARARRELAGLQARSAVPLDAGTPGRDSSSGADEAETATEIPPPIPTTVSIEERDLPTVSGPGEADRMEAEGSSSGAASPAAEGGTAAEIPVSQGRVSAAGQAAYDRGYTLFHQGRYVDAESAFQQFLAAHGTTDLADNAQFWIGEARFARGDLRGALTAFRETVSRYPGGNKVPDAALKTADCLRDLGDLEGARKAYEEVIRKYPATAASAVAEERLLALP
jgi:tol-pal system protein YbgF